MNFERQFEGTVVSTFVRGVCRRPHADPCVQCNGDLKFTHLLDRAAAFGADAVATGHYARLDRDTAPGRTLLRTRTRPREGPVVFPVHPPPRRSCPERSFRWGIFTRRRCAPTLAHVASLSPTSPTAKSSASWRMGTTARFVEERQPSLARAGPIRDQHGLQVGSHNGVHRFTVGQRKGLGLSTSVPLYVLSIDARGERAHRRSPVSAGADPSDRLGGQPGSLAPHRARRTGSPHASGISIPMPRPACTRFLVTGCRWSSTRRSARSHQVRQSCSTTPTPCSAAAGSIDGCSHKRAGEPEGVASIFSGWRDCQIAGVEGRRSWRCRE